MRHGEGVVYVDIGKLGELFAEALVVLLLFRVEAQVLKHHDIPRLHGVDHLLHAGADAVGRHLDILLQQPAEPLGNGRQAHLRDIFALGPSEVRGEYYHCVLVEGVVDGGQYAPYPRVVGYVPVLVERDIEVHADKDLLALEPEFVYVFKPFVQVYRPPLCGIS